MWMVESSMPALAAVVAAPIWKLCLANWDSGSPIACNGALTYCVKVAVVSGFPYLNLKNGPWSTPRTAVKFKTACTGHKGQSILPTNTYTLFPNWSVLDILNAPEELEGMQGCQLPHLPMLGVSSGQRLRGLELLFHWFWRIQKSTEWLLSKYYII